MLCRATLPAKCFNSDSCKLAPHKGKGKKGEQLWCAYWHIPMQWACSCAACKFALNVGLAREKQSDYTGKRPQTVWGSGRIMHDNVEDDEMMMMRIMRMMREMLPTMMLRMMNEKVQIEDVEDDEVEGGDVEDEHVEDDDERMLLLRKMTWMMMMIMMMMMMLSRMMSRGRKMMPLKMMMLRRRKMMMLRRRTEPKTWTPTLYEPAQSKCT